METQESTPAPKYESFKVAKGAYGKWWMYKWQPTIAWLMLGIVSISVGLYSRYSQHLGLIVSIILGILAGILVGAAYNLVAGRMQWQKLSWFDILLGSDPGVF